MPEAAALWSLFVVPVVLVFQGTGLVDRLPSSAPSLQNVRHRERGPIRVGWNDELNRPKAWTALDMENKAAVRQPRQGAIQLVLGGRPADWPYEYQWSGLTQDATLDVARFPVLSARVRNVRGYAHLDVDVLDASGKAIKTLRTSILNADGLSTLDLGRELDPATYSLRVRLIVGGPNQGCEATYDWVRATSRADAEFLVAHPDWQVVLPDRLWGKLR